MSDQDVITMVRVRAIRPFTQNGQGWSVQLGEGDRFQVTQGELAILLARGFVERIEEQGS